MHTINSITLNSCIRVLVCVNLFLWGGGGGEASTVIQYVMFKLLIAYCLCFVADSFMYINFFAESASIFEVNQGTAFSFVDAHVFSLPPKYTYTLSSCTMPTPSVVLFYLWFYRGRWVDQRRPTLSTVLTSPSCTNKYNWNIPL